SPTGMFDSSLEITPNGWGDLPSETRTSSTSGGYNGSGSSTWGNPPPLSKSNIAPATTGWGDNSLHSNSSGWDNNGIGSVRFFYKSCVYYWEHLLYAIVCIRLRLFFFIESA